MPIHQLILDFIYAYIACLAFTLIYNMRGQFVLLAPLGGSIAWIVYNIMGYTENDILQNFVAIMMVALFSEIMARIHKAPVTMFLVVGLLPLVPGRIGAGHCAGVLPVPPGPALLVPPEAQTPGQGPKIKPYLPQTTAPAPRVCPPGRRGNFFALSRAFFRLLRIE